MGLIRFWKRAWKECTTEAQRTYLIINTAIVFAVLIIFVELVIKTVMENL